MENLMPSEVARLVLGYLKSSGCHASWETFLKESPDLKEYAECVRRGREYPTNIAGRNLLQFLDAGHQVLQSQGGENGNSSVELVSNLERVVNQLKGVLAQMQPLQTETQVRSGDALLYTPNQTQATPNGDSAPANYSRQDRTGEGTSRTMPNSSSSSAPPPSRGRSFHPNGDTTTYHLQAIVPPLHFVPTSTPLDKYPEKTHLKDSVVPFDLPEKDLSVPVLRGTALSHSSPMKNQLADIFPYGRMSDIGCPAPYRESGYYTFVNPMSCGTALGCYVSNEEPVRDTGMDLRRKTTDCGAPESSPTGRMYDVPCLPRTGDPPIPPQWRGGEGDRCEPETRTGDDSGGKEVSPVSQGFEVAESATTVSEEIDVDGTSREPSPMVVPTSEASSTPPVATNDATTSVQTSMGSTLRPPTPVSSNQGLHEGQSPAPDQNDSMAAPTPVSLVGDADVDTPAGTEPPPLPTRVPSETSPRCFLSNERSLVPSLTTPIKEVRFSPSRFYSPRRKSLIPRRRLLSVNSPTAKQGDDAGSANTSEEHREVGTVLEELLSNFPFLEKLADNINRVVSTEPTSSQGDARPLGPIPEEQVSPEKQASSSSNSQDLNLNLPESVVKDIMSRTESDPAFEELVAQMCEKIDTTPDMDAVLVTPKSKHLCRTPSSLQKQGAPFTPHFKSPLTTPRRPVTADTPPRHRRSPSSPRSTSSASPSSSGIFQRTRSRLSPRSLDFGNSGSPQPQHTPQKGPSNPPSVSLLDGLVEASALSNASSPMPSQQEVPSSPQANTEANSAPISYQLTTDDICHDPSSRDGAAHDRVQEASQGQQPQPTSVSATLSDATPGPPSNAETELESLSNPPSNTQARLDPPLNAQLADVLPEPESVSDSSPHRDHQPERPSNSSSPRRPTSNPPCNIAPSPQRDCGAPFSCSSDVVPSSALTVPSPNCRKNLTPPQSQQTVLSVTQCLPTGVGSNSSLSYPAMSPLPTNASVIQVIAPVQKASSNCLPPTSEAGTLHTSPVKIVSRTMEGGNTITCISIPDRTPEKRDAPFCGSLADLVDMVLTPNSKVQMEAAVGAENVQSPGRPEAQQSAVFITENGAQVLYCAADTVTAPLQGGGAGPPTLLYPNGTIILGMNPGISPAKVAMPQVAVITETPVAQAYNGLPSAQSKHLPILQPKGPLPARARFIVSQNTQPRRPTPSAAQANRLKKAKTGAVQQTTTSSSTSSSLSSHAVQVPNGVNASRPPTSRNRQRKDRSPQLTMLMRAASSGRARSGAHVRALDFGADVSNGCGERKGGAAEPGAQFDLRGTLECIGSSLTGVVQRVMKTSGSNAEELAKSPMGEPKKRKATPLENEASQKKSRSDDSLRAMDIYTFLDTIHRAQQQQAEPTQPKS